MRLLNVTDYLIRIFEAPPGERSEKDISAILPILTMKIAFLKSLETETVAYILKKAKLETFEEDDVIVRQGDIGDKFYIILQGCVSIYLETKHDDKMKPKEDNTVFPHSTPRRISMHLNSDKVDSTEQAGACSRRDGAPESSRSRMGMDSSRSKRDRSGNFSQRESSTLQQLPELKRQGTVSKDMNTDEKRSRKKYGVRVNTLGRYSSFGELALLYPKGIRNGSAIADEVVYVLSISSEVFKETLQEVFETDIEEKRIFIQTHSFFSKWNVPMQRQLQWSLVRSVHRIGDHVVKQGEHVTGMHFLVRGRARLAAEPLRHRRQFPEFFVKAKKSPFEMETLPIVQRSDTTLSEMAAHLRLTKNRRHLLMGMDPLTYIRRTDGYAAAEKIVFDTIMDICIIEEGEVICDFELLLGIGKNLFSVICTSACTFFHLDSKIFDRMIFKKSPYTLNMMKFLAETKLSRRVSSQQGLRMPIMSPLLSKILDIRVVDPAKDKKPESVENNTISKSKHQRHSTPLIPSLERSQTVLLQWFVQGKTPLLQPITHDAIYYREMIQKRAKYREIAREKGPKEMKEVKSLGRKIKDSFWFNIREKSKAMNTMKRLKLQNSELTPVQRWK